MRIIPQLIPLNWLISLFIVVFIYLVLCFLYYIKRNVNINVNNLFDFNLLKVNKINDLSFSYLW